MQEPDYEGAKAYALTRLAAELPTGLAYHSLQHTRDEVLPAAEWLAAELGVTGEDLTLLLTAACFHDLGFIERREANEVVAVAMAREALPGFGYDERQIDAIAAMIMATRMPQRPGTLLEQILADADLDGLWRAAFMQRNADLRSELAGPDGTVSDAEWYAAQIDFLQSHHYFTTAAEQLRAGGKEENLRQLGSLYEQCKGILPAAQA